MARRRKGLHIHGWLVCDKTAGMTSSQLVGRARRLTGAAKLGHGGTLDPAATGVLPVALGDATKTVAWCQDSIKTYQVTARWGASTTTDDTEGDITATSDARPSRERILAALSSFTGEISQRPPVFSAIKVAGRRAYDLARSNIKFDLEPRTVRIDRITLVGMEDADHAAFEVVCGKGTYIRALVRDLAEFLGTAGHVHALRRTQVGPFTQCMAISVDSWLKHGRNAPACGAIMPVETVLADIPALVVTESQASLLRHGQAVRISEACKGTVRLHDDHGLVAIARTDGDLVRPVRVFNLDETRGHDVDHS